MENTLLQKLLDIENRLTNIENLLKENTDNINTHISFIENVYNTIKNPFYYLMNCISTKKIESIPLKIK